MGGQQGKGKIWSVQLPVSVKSPRALSLFPPSAPFRAETAHSGCRKIFYFILFLFSTGALDIVPESGMEGSFGSAIWQVNQWIFF